VIINNKRIISVDDKILSCEVVLEKTLDRKEYLKITIKAPTLEGKRES
jgi:hypothetical protein